MQLGPALEQPDRLLSLLGLHCRRQVAHELRVVSHRVSPHRIARQTWDESARVLALRADGPSCAVERGGTGKLGEGEAGDPGGPPPAVPADRTSSTISARAAMTCAGC